MVNKTGLPFAVRSARSARTGSPQDVAGDTRTGQSCSFSSGFLSIHSKIL